MTFTRTHPTAEEVAADPEGAAAYIERLQESKRLRTRMWRNARRRSIELWQERQAALQDCAFFVRKTIDLQKELEKERELSTSYLMKCFDQHETVCALRTEIDRLTGSNTRLKIEGDAGPIPNGTYVLLPDAEDEAFEDAARLNNGRL